MNIFGAVSVNALPMSDASGTPSAPMVDDFEIIEGYSSVTVDSGEFHCCV
jgi:hypothetical protein